MFSYLVELFRLVGKVNQMSVELDALKAVVEELKVAVADAVKEIHDLADKIAVVADDKEAVVAVTADVKAAADALHAAVFPPSAAHE